MDGGTHQSRIAAYCAVLGLCIPLLRLTVGTDSTLFLCIFHQEDSMPCLMLYPLFFRNCPKCGVLLQPPVTETSGVSLTNML